MTERPCGWGFLDLEEERKTWKPRCIYCHEEMGKEKGTDNYGCFIHKKCIKERERKKGIYYKGKGSY